MIAHVDNRITYNGNGNATEFAYQFKILDRTDIKVLLTDADGKEKLLTKDYYVDVEKNVVRYPGYAVGAEVPESERPPVLPTGWKLTIYREVPVTQETDLPDQYPFNQVEDIGDKLTMIAQQLTDVTGRSLKIGVSTSADIDTTIPWENGKSFRISDDGKTLELSEDPAKVLPLAQGVYAQTQAQAQSAAASATAAAKSEDSAFESAGVAGNSAQYASASAASAAENAELTSGYKQEALTAKADATASATNAKASEANAKISENNAEASKEAAQSAATTASNFANASRSSANEARTYRDNAKNYSENVNVFVPSVSTDGVLSWSNKAGLTNPPSVNIKGKDGADGGVTVDDALSDTSTNAIQNKVVKAALDNRAVLDDTNTFTSPNKFDDIYMADGMSSLKWYNGSPNFVVASINSERYTGEANTAKKATKDGDGNVITSTYATKTELNSCVKTVNNVAPDSKGNVNISVSGGSNVTVDAELSATSTNPVQNKVIEAALKNKASLDKNNTFSKENLFQKGMSLFAYRDSDSAIKWYQNPVEQPIASIDATNYTGTAAKATQDGAGNVITETYATKADVSGVVKSVNETKPDASGNVNITVGSDVIVDNELSNTSTNPVQNKVVYEALDTKLGKNSFAYGALRDAEGNFITSTYVRSVNGVKPDIGGNVTINVEGGGSITVDTELSSTSTNAIANKAVYDALLGKAGTDIFSGFSLMGAGATINWRQGSQPVGSINATNYTGTASAATHDGAGNVISATYVKSVNNITPDTNGNVSIAVSGGGVSTSEANNWSAQQYFYAAKLQLEKYETTHDSGTTITPVSVITLYNATGNLTLNLTNLTSILSGGESLVFTAYITSAADYALTITNGGTIKYTGSPSDLAITSTGLLLNILITKDISNNITSIVQASKLS